MDLQTVQQHGSTGRGWTTEWENNLDLGQNRTKITRYTCFPSPGPVPGPTRRGRRWTTEWENQLYLGQN